MGARDGVLWAAAGYDYSDRTRHPMESAWLYRRCGHRSGHLVPHSIAYCVCDFLRLYHLEPHQKKMVARRSQLYLALSIFRHRYSLCDSAAAVCKI